MRARTESSSCSRTSRTTIDIPRSKYSKTGTRSVPAARLSHGHPFAANAKCMTSGRLRGRAHTVSMHSCWLASLLLNSCGSPGCSPGAWRGAGW
ncbi:hypothetical protein [Lysobacter gummosus]|uniref:hypothetical protein n=1 Tax=Lysobacter gummosus TaxID=262324 RepID=UPI00362FA792